jgi:hypothetical protein
MDGTPLATLSAEATGSILRRLNAASEIDTDASSSVRSLFRYAVNRVAPAAAAHDDRVAGPIWPPRMPVRAARVLVEKQPVILDPVRGHACREQRQLAHALGISS